MTSNNFLITLAAEFVATASDAKTLRESLIRIIRHEGHDEANFEITIAATERPSSFPPIVAKSAPAPKPIKIKPKLEGATKTKKLKLKAIKPSRKNKNRA